MRRALLGIVIFLSLPPVARASDAQLISSFDAGTQFSAAAPWVVWSNEGVPRIWNGMGVATILKIPGDFSLGTDAHRQQVLTYWRCRSSFPQCAIVQRDIKSTIEHVLLRDNARYGAVAEAGGTLAFTRNPRHAESPAAGSGLYLRPRGARHSVRLSSDQPYDIDVGAGKLVYAAFRPTGGNTFDTVIRMFDLKTRRATLIADVSDFAADCRCTDTVTYADSPRIDGHYLYWLTSTYPTMVSNQPAQIQIDRLDLRSPSAPPVAYVADRDVRAFTVAGGVIYYGVGLPSYSSLGVYRVADPTWQATSVSIPVK